MLRISFFFFAGLFTVSSARAQYYYKDLVSNKQLLAEMNIYKENKIHTVSLKSFDDDGQESEGFFCEKKINRDYTHTNLRTRANIAAASEFESDFDADGKLLHTNDSSALSVTDIVYTYDNKQRIHSISSSVHSQDEDFNNHITEDHIYFYNEKGIPEKMLLVKNGKDTAEIDFAPDEKGNIMIEKNTSTGSTYYYYYDAKNRLTDIVHGTDSDKRLKPDYMFEYNSVGQVSQMTSVEEGTSNYFVWKYSYDDGLRMKDRCFSDEHRLVGSVEYSYK